MPYVEGKKTVLCNATNGILNTPIPNPLGGRGGISLDKGDYVDIEKVMSKAAIRKFMPELERIENSGYIKWEAKGSKPHGSHIPIGGFKPSPIGSTVMPPTPFDEKLNELIKAEEERDKRTLPGSLHRQTQAEYDARLETSGDAATLRAHEAEKAKLVDKERELAEKEAWLAVKEAEMKKEREQMATPQTVAEPVAPAPRTRGGRVSVAKAAEARAKAEAEAAEAETPETPAEETEKGTSS